MSESNAQLCRREAAGTLLTGARQCGSRIQLQRSYHCTWNACMRHSDTCLTWQGTSACGINHLCLLLAVLQLL